MANSSSLPARVWQTSVRAAKLPARFPFQHAQRRLPHGTQPIFRRKSLSHNLQDIQLGYGEGAQPGGLMRGLPIFLVQQVSAGPAINQASAFTTLMADIYCSRHMPQRGPCWHGATPRGLQAYFAFSGAVHSFIWSILKCVPGLLACLYLMAEVGSMRWFRFLAWLAIGLAIYFSGGRRKSKPGHAEGK